ncbi:histidinol-phosphatase HisJ [Paenibacillus sp. FSL R7-0652]|uniref:Histidinol-phosphatase n=1 Tax=Paenibacillus sp. AN1007 TaxID=3151385 RepID=A0AAU8ND04_9BACL
MRIDYHTHHERCGHAVGKLEEYVQRGIAIGLSQIGLSDHMPLLHVDPAEYYPEMAMPMDELPRYVEECFSLKERYRGQIDVRVGLEGDYIEGFESEIRSIIERYPWDYVIGSVHFLGEWDITDFRQTHHWEGKDILEVYRQYYDAVSKSAASGLYDIIGHSDVIKRFGYVPPLEQTEERIALEDAALQAVAKSGCAMELNASGLSKPCAEMFPSRRMLTEAIRLGVPLTMGSDAHDPMKLGDNLPEAEKLLHELGCEQVAVFESRQRSFIPLNAANSGV